MWHVCPLKHKGKAASWGSCFLGRFSLFSKTDMTELFPFFCLWVMLCEDVMPGAAAAVLFPQGVVNGLTQGARMERWNGPGSSKTFLRAGLTSPGSSFSGLRWDGKFPTFQAILVGIFCYVVLKSIQTDTVLWALPVFILFSDTGNQSLESIS